MNPLRIICVAAFLMAAVTAAPNQQQQQQHQQNNLRANGGSNKLKPSQWLSSSELEQIPSVEDVSVQRLENMSVEKGAKMLEQIYHLSQINQDLRPTYVPSPSNVPVYLVKSNGQKESTTLNQLASAAKQQSNFGDEEVTIFITGLPAQTETIKKANRKLINAYLQRYNNQKQQPQNYAASNENSPRTSSEENSSEWKNQQPATGNLVIIDLGSNLNNFKRFAMLDVERTGAMIGNAIVEMTEKCDVPNEIVHIVAQNIAAHVAGAAGNEFTRQTGRQLRRITALDPSKIYAKNPHTLTGLSRGDAEVVDAIHTTTYGLGTPQRVGKVDYFPNGPSASVPGAQNVIEATMRATRYFAESVRPGNERNFPAVAAKSLNDYQNNNGHGKRAYMGINTDYDIEGDYILQVNAKSPFGKRAPAQKQNSYHGGRKASKNSQDYQ